MLLRRTSALTVVPKRAAISESVSPRWTVYVVVPLGGVTLPPFSRMMSTCPG